MNFESYLNHFNQILDSKNPQEPYNDPAFMEYVKLNWSRLNRWLKNGKITDELKRTLANVKEEQNWLVITEPWCGDAAHIVPFIHLISELSPMIKVNYELRDSEPFSIDKYLTNGGKSIPVLVVRDSNNKDIFRWGPRPKLAQEFFLDLKNKGIEMDQVKVSLQQWYNQDKGQAMQNELEQLLSNISNQTSGH